MRKLTYYMAVSIDGVIEGPGGEIDFYPLADDHQRHMMEEYPDVLPAHARTALGIEAENTRFDTVVMGRRTYDPALREGIVSPYTHLRQYVFSRTLTASPSPDVEIVSSDPVAKVRELKREPLELDIYLAGGADLAGQLLDEIDRIVLKLYPVVAGSGLRLFEGATFRPAEFSLTSHQVFSNGTTVHTYDRS